MPDVDPKRDIEQAIARARDGVGERIDELDRTLRAQLDPKVIVRSYAPHLIAGGAVAGLLIGFTFPKVLRSLVTWGVPVAILAMAIKGARERGAGTTELP